MERQEAKERVIQALIRTLERADCPKVNASDLTDEKKPIGDLELESMEGIGFACELEELGIPLDAKCNPFVDDDQQCARTIAQIIDFVMDPANVAGSVS